MALTPKQLQDLYKLFSSAESIKEVEKLLKDILTPQELECLSERWQLIQELHLGKPQRKIAAELGISISKITRGSHMLQHGTGGFQYFLNKLQK